MLLLRSIVNIEIEIYGMEGIPEDDLKEHEKQRQGKGGRRFSDDEDSQVSLEILFLN